MQVMSEMLAAHVLSHYDKFLEGVNTIATFERELQACSCSHLAACVLQRTDVTRNSSLAADAIPIDYMLEQPVQKEGALACCLQRSVALIKHARQELQTELAYVGVGYAVVTQTAAKGRLLDTLDILATLASVRSLPSAVKCALQRFDSSTAPLRAALGALHTVPATPSGATEDR